MVSSLYTGVVNMVCGCVNTVAFEVIFETCPGEQRVVETSALKCPLDTECEVLLEKYPLLIQSPAISSSSTHP